MPFASGPGVNADEADSMMQSLAFHKGALAKEVMDILEHMKGDEDVEDVAITNREVLMKIAQLVTGQWGPSRTVMGEVEGAQKFIRRMEELSGSLDYLISEIERKKPFSEGKVGKAKRNPWIRGINNEGRPGGLIICKKAVDYILREGIFRRTIFKGGKPFGLTWGILAKGNGKLPFVAYSELPMATCPGAGDCAVYSKRSSKDSGWCYSFKAWRYPDAFARQFLNTLANVADDALAQFRGGKELTKINPKPKLKSPTSWKWDKYLQPGKRVWPNYIKWLVLYMTRTKRKSSTPMFLRLFVDGDMRNARNVQEWMAVCRDMEQGKASTRAYGAKAHVEVYGYSKAWAAFAAVRNKVIWPRNYTLNMSGGSIYWNNDKIRSIMESLPITRGYFVATNLHGAMEKFIDQFSGHILTDKITDEKAIERIRSFSAINDLSNVSDAWEAANKLAKKLGIEAPTQKQKKKAGDQSVMSARAALFTNWIDSLVNNPEVADAAALEIVADRATSFAAFNKMSAAQKQAKANAIPRAGKAMRDKVIAMHLHEVLWAFGAGGSCPLICGNCFDDINPLAEGAVHRCASKPGRMFGRTRDGDLGATIHIGLH